MIRRFGGGVRVRPAWLHIANGPLPYAGLRHNQSRLHLQVSVETSYSTASGAGQPTDVGNAGTLVEGGQHVGGTEIEGGTRLEQMETTIKAPLACFVFFCFALRI